MPVQPTIRSFSRLSVARALGVIFVLVALLAALLVFSGSSFIKQRSVNQLATAEAQRASELIFQNLYAAMRRGATRDELHRELAGITGIIPDIEVALVRGPLVSALFGEPDAQPPAAALDSIISEALTSGRQRLFEQDEQLRFVYPVIVRQECVACHVNTQPGDVNGVIDIRFPINKLRVPLEFAIASVIYLFTAAAVVLVLLTYLSVHHFLVRPIAELAEHMRSTSDSHDLGKRLPAERKAFREVAELGSLFNALLDRLEVSYRQLRERSERDPLTGLINRRRFNELAEDELERSRRHGREFCVLAVDLNGFKPINDTWGHETGDELLCEVAHALRIEMRNQDVVARMGGDEFLVLMPETAAEQGEAAAARLKEAVRRASIRRDDRPVSVGAAVGMATYPRDGEAIEELVKAADSAMYADKGRVR